MVSAPGMGEGMPGGGYLHVVDVADIFGFVKLVGFVLGIRPEV